MIWQEIITPIWDLTTVTDEQIIIAIRSWRNRELAASDWTQLSDVDLANKWDWAVYRQELRDMMNKGVPPKEIVFPTPPV